MQSQSRVERVSASEAAVKPVSERSQMTSNNLEPSLMDYKGLAIIFTTHNG